MILGLKRKLLLIVPIMLAFFGIGLAVWLEKRTEEPNKLTTNKTNAETNFKSNRQPVLKEEVIADGFSNPWDVAQAPDGTLFYSERGRGIGIVHNKKGQIFYKPEGVFIKGEGGVLGMTLDPSFIQNRFLYVCFNTNSDIRLSRLKIGNDNKSMLERKDIVLGMPVNTDTFPGRHSGCRPRFSPDGLLWVGTGDVAQTKNPQSKTSLGGKVLRIDRDGQPVSGNNNQGFDPRVFSWGHRNTQGLAFYSTPRNGVVGYSIEHGSNKDDEINLLKTGNFGWDPGPNYDESVEMTDLAKFPDAEKAVWASGNPTIAPSGAVIIEGKQWQAWNGRLAVAVQKGKHIRLFEIADDAKTIKSEQKILENHGRIRSLIMGNDGAIYVTTDNGKGQDKILKLTPH